MSETLSPGWTQSVSRKTGKTYYYNTITGESQWERPDSEDRVCEKVMSGYFCVVLTWQLTGSMLSSSRQTRWF